MCHAARVWLIAEKRLAADTVVCVCVHVPLRVRDITLGGQVQAGSVCDR